VMNTQQEIRQAVEDFRAGKLAQETVTPFQNATRPFICAAASLGSG
jgi:hypothetical protein